MTRKLLSFLGIACFLTLMSSSTSRTARKRVNIKPNILFIFTDDQRYNTVSTLGNDEVITPNLDALVKKGTVFTHAYNMGAWHGAVCVASRAMLVTGLSVWDAKNRKLITHL